MGAESQYQYDGNLVLGGYDSAKITGPNVTLATSDPKAIGGNCYRVRVSDVVMNLKNGSSMSILDSKKVDEELGCILPHFEALSLPSAMWDKFLGIPGSTYVKRSSSVLAWFGMLVEADGA